MKMLWYGQSFLSQVAVVLLGSLALMELSSFLGLSPSVTSVLGTHVNWIISLVIVVISLLGIFGLLFSEKWGGYSAFLAPLSETVFGSYSIMKIVSLPRPGAVQLLQNVLAIALGVLTSVAVLRSGIHIGSTKRDPGSPVSTLPVDDYAVKIVNVTKRYSTDPTVLAAVDGLSLNVRRGEFLAIMGPSGSGKSTLLNLLGALDRPTSGQILIDGVDIATLDDSGLARLRNEKIGFVFQAYNLIDRSRVLRNIELPAMVRGSSKSERLKRTHDLLSMVGIDDKADRRPKTLSGGEQQRVAICRALVNDPKIVLADEPTGNLDSKTGSEIVGYLKKMSVEKGTTMIVVTHNPEVAEVADRTIHFRDGKIVREVSAERKAA